MTTGRRPGLRSVLTTACYRRLFAAQTISRWAGTDVPGYPGYFLVIRRDVAGGRTE